MYNSNINFRIKSKDKEKLKKLAQKGNKTISQVLRLLVENYLKGVNENG